MMRASGYSAVISFILALGNIVYADSHLGMSALEAELLGTIEAEPKSFDTSVEEQESADNEKATALDKTLNNQPLIKPQRCDDDYVSMSADLIGKKYSICGHGETIMDNNTGLMWSRCALGKTWNSNNKKCEGEAEILNWQEALQNAKLGNKKNYLESNDWRLPNIKELSSIVNTACISPAVDSNVFPDTDNTEFWTSSVFEQFPARAWFVNFDLGHDYAADKRYYKQIRLVRLGKGLSSYDIATGETRDWRSACVISPKFDFTALTDVPINTEIRSEQVMVNFSGAEATRRMSIENGEYEINSSGTWSSVPGVINNGDKVMVRHISSSNYLDDTNTTLSVGNTSGEFTSTTMKEMMPKYEEKVLDGQILFEYKSYDLTSEAKTTINNYLEKFQEKSNQIEMLIVLGHTDSIASEEYNQTLSENRANAVANYIKSIDYMQNVQLQAIGIGEIDPVTTNETAEGRQQNRRVVLRVEFK